MVLRVEFVENCSNNFLLIVLLTLGDFMKKGIFEWAIIIWTILLVFLITGWIMIEFYNWKDTIVAAIIAFVGAIIGGSITLIGVRMTISEAKRKDEVELFENKIFAGEYIIDELSKLLEIADIKTMEIFFAKFLETQEESTIHIEELEIYNEFVKQINENHNRIRSSQLNKKLGYSIYKEIKDFFDDDDMRYKCIDEKDYLEIFFDVGLREKIEEYRSKILNLKKNFEIIQNNNLDYYRKILD